MARKSIEAQRLSPPTDDGELLEKKLVSIAEKFLRVRAWVMLPGPDFYRDRVLAIKNAAEHLLSSIQSSPREAVWSLGRLVQRDLGMTLQSEGAAKDQPYSPDGFERLLVQLIASCETASRVQGSQGARGRPDLVCAAAGLAELWAKLSGKPFPKTLDATRGDKAEFTSPGPHFVRELLPAFDPEITFAQARTALKAMAVKPTEDQEFS